MAKSAPDRAAARGNTAQDSGATPDAVIAAPFGMLSIWTEGDRLSLLSFEAPATQEKAPASALSENIARQLLCWFNDPRHVFDVPLKDCGTPFQQRTRQAIAAIPRGRVRTYGDIARELNSAARAVGQACRANPFPIIIPCHRVVSASGIGGFHGASSGYLIDAKQWLLQYETSR